MATAPSELLYLEPDDEITAVVRRLRASGAERVVLVASGRTKATSSAIAIRLLAQVAADEGRRIALVADPAARALAAEAGIDAFASVADAEAEEGPASPPPAPHHATIRIIRDAPEPMSAPPAARATAGPTDETRAVPVVEPEPEPSPQRATRGRGGFRMGMRRRTLLLALVSILLVGGAALAAVLPAATVIVTPATRSVGPRDYTVQPPVGGTETDTLRSTKQGTASGTRTELVAATGTVTLLNWNGPNTPVEVPAGTVVAVSGGAEFRTDARVLVPGGHFAGGPIESGEANVAVTAVKGGTGGNVAAKAIDTVVTASIASLLTGPFQILPLVTNNDPTSGGDEVQHPVIEQADVDATVAAMQSDIAAQVAALLTADSNRIYAPGPAVQVVVDVPGDLVGTEDTPSFELSASYDLSRPYVTRSAVESAAAAAMQSDAQAVPSGMTLVPDSIATTIGSAQTEGGTLSVDVTVNARAAATVDVAAARQQVLGLTPAEAQDALSSAGSVEVHLWPGWVDRIPRLDWRVAVEVAGQ